MAQHGSQYYPSLVHQHSTLSQPPSLSASGTFALSTNAHDMLTNATTHDSPSPPSTSSSSSRLDQPPVFSMPPALPAQATDHDSYKTRYERDPRYDPALMEEEIDTDRIVIRHQIRRHFHEAVKQRDGARPYRVPGSRVVDPDSQIYDRMGARPNPSPQPHPPFPSDERRSHVQESLSPSPSSQHSSITYAPSHSRSGSSSGSSSAPRNESPVFGVETSLLPHPSLETPGSLVHLLWAPTKTTPNLGGKNKKQRLYSVDRKVICEFAQQNPSYKQEEIARKFNIERSTVSKILKNKHRWLRVSNDETVYYAKDRHAKFPGLEMYMKEWVKKCHEDNVPMTDALIAARALELARARGYTEKEFKASPGWVENFKHRVGISKNRWHGRTKWHKSMTTLPEDMETMDDKIEARRWHEEDDLPALPEPTPEELALTQQVQPTPAVPRQEPLTIEYTRVDTPPQVRRHPVWLPDHQDDVDRPNVDEPRLGYSNTPAHAASSARPYESEPIIEPPVGVTAYSEDGSAHIVVPQGPNYRPNVGAEPSHNDAETSIDTLLIFFKNVRPDMLSMEQRHLLHTIKEELFMAGN